MDITKIIRSDVVASLITEGVIAQKSALETIRSAALEFVELIPRDYESSDVPAIIKHGRSLYAEDFQSNQNLSAWFGDVATLSLLGNAPISFEVKRTVAGKPEKQEMHTTAAEAVTLSKHDLKAAASAAREGAGIGRESGGGRKPTTPTSAPPQAKTVFSTVEFNGLLAGLFGHSKNPVAVLNKSLAEYRCAVIGAGDLEAFTAWKKANTKAAK